MMSFLNFVIAVVICIIFPSYKVDTVPIEGGIHCPDNRTFENGWVRYELPGAFYSQRQLVPGTGKTFGCRSGFSLVGNRTIVCGTNGKWTTRDPVCVAGGCQTPFIWSGSLLGNHGDIVPTGTFVEYECMQFAEKTEEGDIRCLDGEWYPSEPGCREKSCTYPALTMGLYILDRVEDDFVLHGSLIKFGCYADWEMKGEASGICWYGQWNINTPQCVSDTSEYSECGLAGDTSVQGLTGRIIGGFDANQGAWPWQAGIYWMDGRNKWHFFCGGSLIDNRWVMSAGHCFGYDEDITKIQVRLGTTDRTGDRGTDREQVLLIDALYLPKQHDFRGFDYDIALLHLDRSVALNQYVHTICLPPEPESSNPDGLVEVGVSATVVGWGHFTPVHWNSSEMTSYKNDLQQLTIPIRPRKVCINSLKQVGEDVSQFTNTMFCAGFNKKAKDTCFGDSGGPLMRNVMHNGKRRWVQVGIVSAGKGCAISGQYAYYAHIPKLLPWIGQVMTNYKPTNGNALIQV
ncbi:limulus clotting factor C-like isoform X2 [Anneissia japonica]|uniref:limulus clotting factor C-like isoform X2 n=1 Tax=Anneissia japonica TaxID=1529436 RepID=UPI0014256614|nr:limulus clotting factor C-like isoform X2 [Anneissia japonica]